MKSKKKCRFWQALGLRKLRAFHFDADPDPDPVPTPSWKDVEKSEIFFHQSIASLHCFIFLVSSVFNILYIILKFSEKRIVFFTFVSNRYPVRKGIRIRICQNDADPTGSRSGSTTLGTAYTDCWKDPDLEGWVQAAVDGLAGGGGGGRHLGAVRHCACAHTHSQSSRSSRYNQVAPLGTVKFLLQFHSIRSSRYR